MRSVAQSVCVQIVYAISSRCSGSQIIRTIQAIVSMTPTIMSAVGNGGNFLNILFLRAIAFRIMNSHDS
jgi:hypothetical protein